MVMFTLRMKTLLDTIRNISIFFSYNRCSCKYLRLSRLPRRFDDTWMINWKEIWRNKSQRHLSINSELFQKKYQYA